MKKKKLTKFCSSIFETPYDKSANWFGYYNYDTLSRDKTKMLCNRSAVDDCKIERGMTIELGYYDILTGEWHNIGSSDSWNWQQGAMLQWLPGENNENKVIYNFSKENHFKACIHDIDTQEEKIIDYPIYCITPDGKKSISLNYERSYWCRAYHYQSVVNNDYDVRVAEDDGIFEVDLEKNAIRRIVDIQDVISFDSDENFSVAKHWLEHIMISPDGLRIAFLHRFSFGKGYSTRLCIANIDGTDLQVIQGWRHYNWSHFEWQGNNEFAIYTVETTKLVNAVSAENHSLAEQHQTIKSLTFKYIKNLVPRNIRKRLANKSYYQHYKLEDGKFVLAGVYGGAAVRIDGHPSFTADKRYMITDSYPFEDGFQHLLIYDTKTGKSCILGRLYASLKDSPASCDLHPKLSNDGEYVVIDTAYSGVHKMICLKINWKLVKQHISN